MMTIHRLILKVNCKALNKATTTTKTKAVPNIQFIFGRIFKFEYLYSLYPNSSTTNYNAAKHRIVTVGVDTQRPTLQQNDD